MPSFVADQFDRWTRREEDRKYKAYADPLTKREPYTIGIGHTGPEVHAGLVWDDAQIDFAYQLDKAAAWQGCLDHFEPWFSKLTPARQAVLAAMAFQMGIRRVLEFHNTLAACARGDYAATAQGMRDSDWGHQTPARVERAATMMETGTWLAELQ